MSEFRSEVSEAAVLRQAVLNTSQSIELLREAVSNSVDADARSIDIKLACHAGDEWNIVIQDDGNGMSEAHVKAFFNAGQTVKDFPQSEAIGEKGLGSKTTFVARQIEIISRRKGDPDKVLVATMVDPMSALRRGELPLYTLNEDPTPNASTLKGCGTRITLSRVLLKTFNGKSTSDPKEIASRVLHYLRSMCATGTVKNRHAAKEHIANSIMNVGVLPKLTVEVVSAKGSENLGPVSGAFQVPEEDLDPTAGPIQEGIVQRSKNFCAVLGFSGSRTISVMGSTSTVHYDGTAIVAGESVRSKMLSSELKQGWTQKSQMGVHLCKDFIPLRADSPLSRDLIDPEYYYEYKVFINSQAFQLNADRNVVTNIESDEVAWIFEDFRARVSQQLEAKARPYRLMVKEENAAIEAAKKTAAASQLKHDYATLADLPRTRAGADLLFVKRPRKEADVSHMLAMMVQAGHWQEKLSPISRFGQYIDDSTDIIAQGPSGETLLVEVEFELSNLFRHRHPMTSYDLVGVWSLGGMESGSSKTAPWGTNGSEVPVVLLHDNQGWRLKWGTHTKPVIVLRELFEAE